MAFFLLLFVFRVAGQLMVANGLAPYLPPMNEWQSGLLPYPVLVFFQIIIIFLYAKVCFDIKKGEGFFFHYQPVLKKYLLLLGIFYLVAMVLRYVIYMTLVPEARWLKGTIPIIFHMILAGFIILYASLNLERKRQN